MGILDLTQKEMELILRLYLGRCDRKPLYWYYYDDGTGLVIKVKHKALIKALTLDDLANFFFAEEKSCERFFDMSEKK